TDRRRPARAQAVIRAAESTRRGAPPPREKEGNGLVILILCEGDARYGAWNPGSPGPGGGAALPNRMLCGRWLKFSSERFSARTVVRVSLISGTAWHSTTEAAEPTLSAAAPMTAIAPSGA